MNLMDFQIPQEDRTRRGEWRHEVISSRLPPVVLQVQGSPQVPERDPFNIAAAVESQLKVICVPREDNLHAESIPTSQQEHHAQAMLDKAAIIQDSPQVQKQTSLAEMDSPDQSRAISTTGAHGQPKNPKLGSQVPLPDKDLAKPKISPSFLDAKTQTESEGGDVSRTAEDCVVVRFVSSEAP